MLTTVCGIGMVACLVIYVIALDQEGKEIAKKLAELEEQKKSR